MVQTIPLGVSRMLGRHALRIDVWKRERLGHQQNKTGAPSPKLNSLAVAIL